jgi:3-oxoacyl-[acyl-carrier protein] reductase
VWARVRLEDRKAIVTGAGRGIGRAIAAAFAREGADVVVCDMNYAAVQAVARDLESPGRRIVPIAADVTRKAQVDAMVARAAEVFGRVDILVNNAGILRDAMLHKMTEEDFDQVIAVHLKGTWLCCRAVVAGMRERQFGRIINMSSISGKNGNVGQTNYSAAKAGILGLTKAAALELARHNVTVNAIMPAFVDTDMTRSIPEGPRLQSIAAIPMQRVGQPEDVAGMAVFLASEEGAYVTGAVLEVTGGLGL